MWPGQEAECVKNQIQYLLMCHYFNIYMNPMQKKMTLMHQSFKIIRDQEEPASLSKLIYCGKSLSLKSDFNWYTRISCQKCITACMTVQLDE